MPLTQPLVVKISGGTVSSNRSDVTFSNANNVTFGLETNGVLTGSVVPQSNQTVGLYMSSNTNLTSSGTVDARSMTVRGVGVATVGYSAGELVVNVAAGGGGLTNIKVSAGTLSANRSDLTFNNSNGVSFGLETDGIITGTVKTDYLTSQSTDFHAVTLGGNTAGTNTFHATNNRTIFLHGGNNITLSGNGSSITISGVNQTLYDAGDVSVTGNSIPVFGSGLVVVTASNGTLVVSASPVVSWYATSNTTNASSDLVADIRSVVFRGAGGASVGFSNGTVLISGAAPGGGVTFSQFDPFVWQNVTNATLGQSTVYLVPFLVPNNLYGSRVNFFLNNTRTLSGAPNNQTARLALGYGLYVRGAGTASDRLTRHTSYSLDWISGSVSSSTRLSLTHYVGLSNVTSHSTSQYGVQNASVTSYIANSVNGFRVLALPLNSTLTPGNYWMAVSVQSVSQNGSFILGQSIVQAQFSNNIAFRVFGSNSAASNASFFVASNGAGIFSAQTAGFPDTINMTSDTIRAAPVVTLPYFNISGIGTAVGVL